MDKLRKNIHKIGNKMIRCNKCDDVIHNLDKGILPRCLIFDESIGENTGCVVIGINP